MACEVIDPVSRVHELELIDQKLGSLFRQRAASLHELVDLEGILVPS
jgi:hypothetical protein